MYEGEYHSKFAGNYYDLPESYVNFYKSQRNVFSDFKMLYTHKSFGEHKIGAMSSIYIHTPTTYSIFSRFQQPFCIIIILILLILTTSVGRGVVARGGSTQHKPLLLSFWYQPTGGTCLSTFVTCT